MRRVTLFCMFFVVRRALSLLGCIFWDALWWPQICTMFDLVVLRYVPWKILRIIPAGSFSKNKKASLGHWTCLRYALRTSSCLAVTSRPSRWAEWQGLWTCWYSKVQQGDGCPEILPINNIKQHVMAIVRGSMMIGQWVLHRSKYESLEGHRIV